MLDLDQFGKIIKEVGWSEYKPNRVTGCLSSLVMNLLSKHHGTHIQGLDNKRGTEEAILFFSDPDLEELLGDLESIKENIYRGDPTAASSHPMTGNIVPSDITFTLRVTELLGGTGAGTDSAA